jgi:pyruvate dehydrogenase E2 component (dihydrolipoamide acetyltransferase)
LATDVTMPRLSDSMEEGTVLKWLVDEGGEVKRGEALVEIETDKANMTYEADTDGTLLEIVAQEGDTLAIGEVIARIGEAGEANGAGGDEEAAGDEEDIGAEPEAEEEPSEDAGESKEAEGEEAEEGAVAEGEDEAAAESGDDESDADAEEAEADGDGATSDAEPQEAETATATRERPDSGSNGAGADSERVKASPVARRMAREMGVEIAQLEGSGPGGRIVKADVEAAAKDGGPAEPEPEKGKAEVAEDKEEAPEPQRERAEAGNKGEVEYQELSRLQQVVTRRMAESKATAPDFALTLDVDMTLAVELRARLKEVADPAPSFNDMVVKACANALREHPRVNGAYRDGKFELYSNVNVGMAVAASDALVVPTIFDADTKSLGQIARDARGLIEKVREQKVTPPEVSGGTFTVSNLGMFGIESFTAIINPPQAALLAVGALAKKPAVDDSGRVVARDQMSLTLICDHRILYGADGAQFLARVRELLEQPLSLAL